MILLGFVSANICIFSVSIYAFVYAPILWRNCFDLRFKIDTVVMII